MGAAIGTLYPQRQQFTGSLNSIKISRHAQQAAFSRIFHYSQAQFGLTASWELDFWGKFRRSIESAGASLFGAEADYDNALVSLTADVARAWT